MSRGTALVTGSAAGIGRATALALAEDGFNVVIHYRSSQAGAEEAAKQCIDLGVRSAALQADLRVSSEARDLVRRADGAFSGSSLAVLVNNVGNYINKPLLEITNQDWQEMLDSNLTSTFSTCQEAALILKNKSWGRIVNLGYAGSRNFVARPNILPYIIAKMGVLELSRSMALVLAGSGTSVNVVSPGVIETSISQPTHEIPSGRTGRVSELVEAVMYFIHASDYITGQEIEVAGAWNL